MQGVFLKKSRGFLCFVLLLALGGCMEDAKTVFPAEILAVNPSAVPGEDNFYIVEIAPVNGDITAPSGTEIFIRFNRPVNAATIPGNITISGPTTFTATPVGSANEALVLDTFVPGLAIGPAYTITFTSGLTDTEGRSLDITYSAVTAGVINFVSATTGNSTFTCSL